MAIDPIIETIKEQRGIPFIKKGMRVQSIHNGKFGLIKGGNWSGNLLVLMDGEKKKGSYHPTWQMRYFEKDGSLIKEFGE